ncbi:MAG: BolA/IbaG family iron-sulfur metabolism protein [Pseudomonadota bacterium]
MAMQADEIKALIQAAFPTADVTISDLAGDGNHYAAEVVATEFAGKSRVQQQRMVYASLKGAMDGSDGQLHALALTTKVKD